MDIVTGALTEEAEVKGFCTWLQQAVVRSIGKHRVQMYEPLTYRSQVDADGMIYFVKVQIVNDGSCLLLQLFQPTGTRDIRLEDLQGNNREENPLIALGRVS